MSQTVGYLVDVSGVQLDDSNGCWIQAMTMGSYEHPFFGEIKFDETRVKNFADNVAARVISKDPDIDYEHKMGPEGGKAAGWVKQAEARADGLYLYVEWTPEAVKKLKDREYRYFSPEFVDEFVHPKTKKLHKDVVLGGALTNRPFLKDILPINLSEVFEKAGEVQVGDQDKPKTSDEVLKDMAKAKGVEVKDDMTPEQLMAAIQAKDSEPGDDDNGNTGDAGDKDGDNKPAETSLSDTLQLSDADKQNPVVAAVLKLAETQGQQIQALTQTVGQLSTANKLAEADAAVKGLSDGKRRVAPAVEDRVKQLLVGGASNTKQFQENLLGVIGDLVSGKGVVELGERGASRTGASGGGDSIKQFTDKVEALREKNKQLSYYEATIQVSKSDPDLYNAYMEATMEVGS